MGALDDPVALRSERLFRSFARYLRWRMGREFNAVRLSRIGAPAPGSVAGPIVVYGNHPSWWDPAMYILLADMLFPERVAFGPMDQEAFARYGIFRRMGVFGISPDVSGARRFLQATGRVLALPNGMMWVTAEGAFNDPRTRPVTLRPGLAHMARAVPNVRFLPLALGYGFWNESRPEAFCRFGAPVTIPDGMPTRAATALLASGLEREMDALADDVAGREDAPFVTLISGRKGAGAIYDQWRRARALLRGRRFDASHGAVSGATGRGRDA